MNKKQGAYSGPVYDHNKADHSAVLSSHAGSTAALKASSTIATTKSNFRISGGNVSHRGVASGKIHESSMNYFQTSLGPIEKKSDELPQPPRGLDSESRNVYNVAIDFASSVSGGGNESYRVDFQPIDNADQYQYHSRDQRNQNSSINNQAAHELGNTTAPSILKTRPW